MGCDSPIACRVSARVLWMISGAGRDSFLLTTPELRKVMFQRVGVFIFKCAWGCVPRGCASNEVHKEERQRAAPRQQRRQRAAPRRRQQRAAPRLQHLQRLAPRRKRALCPCRRQRRRPSRGARTTRSSWTKVWNWRRRRCRSGPEADLCLGVSRIRCRGNTLQDARAARADHTSTLPFAYDVVQQDQTRKSQRQRQRD